MDRPMYHICDCLCLHALAAMGAGRLHVEVLQEKRLTVRWRRGQRLPELGQAEATAALGSYADEVQAFASGRFVAALRAGGSDHRTPGDVAKVVAAAKRLAGGARLPKLDDLEATWDALSRTPAKELRLPSHLERRTELHALFVSLEQLGMPAMSYFIEPVVLALNYAQRLVYESLLGAMPRDRALPRLRCVAVSCASLSLPPVRNPHSGDGAGVRG